MKRINALESLRGLLALWVVAGHVFRYAGYGDGMRLGFLAPGYAVDVFIILSGFVIFYLLDHQRLSYRDFICRRFFRLAPLFFAVVLVSIPSTWWQLDVLKAIPWHSDKLGQSITIQEDTIEHLGQHILAHATMLHGLLSNAILPSSEYSLVGQAWSISVEWQFYLVAPLFFWLIVTRRWYALAAALVVICAVRFTNYGGEGFGIRQGGFFLIGIFSYYAYRRLENVRLDCRMIDGLAMAAVALVYMFLVQSLSLFIWIAVFALLIAARQERQTLPQRVALNILNHPSMQWLGRISYSVYLIHALVIFAVANVILGVAPEIEQAPFAAILMAATGAATLIISALSYRLIERPGIALGQRLTAAQPTVPPTNRGQIPA